MDDYDYELPAEVIAQEPAEPRSAARLLVATDADGGVEHRTVADLPELVGPGDVVVVNETKVLPARLLLHKPTGGAVEVLLLEDRGEGRWEALIRPGKRVKPGTRLLHGDVEVVEAEGAVDDGRRMVRLLSDPHKHGRLALPPYIHKTLVDDDRYQTVYARSPGSVAAPTAGLHLSDDVIERIRSKGAALTRVDLAVGLDTFRPVTAARPEDHVMHSERYRVPEDTMARCERAERVIAIGTTTVRALESAAATGELEGRTRLFITPGFEFRVVDVLLTNYHLPRSTLLLMLAAFVGPRWRSLYDMAQREGYRFLSFGDAMLVARQADQHRADRLAGRKP